ncbi:citrate/2-methylcitrate synthase, partial [Faecalibaculum rodentium]
MELEKDDLRALYNRSAENNLIDPSLYARYRVKQGLRNENGTGVKVGLTRICDVVGYQMIHGHKHDTEGQLIYRGYTIDELVRRQKEAGTAMGYETTAFLLIFGHLPDEQELQAFRTTLLHNIHTDFIAAKYPTSNLLNAMQIEVLKMYAQ